MAAEPDRVLRLLVDAKALLREAQAASEGMGDEESGLLTTRIAFTTRHLDTIIVDVRDAIFDAPDGPPG